MIGTLAIVCIINPSDYNHAHRLTGHIVFRGTVGSLADDPLSSTPKDYGAPTVPVNLYLANRYFPPKVTLYT